MKESDAVFVEVSSPGWAFWRALLDTGVGLIVGLLYAFLALLVSGIVGEEALSTLYSQIDLDPLLRASMGVILLFGAILAATVPFVLVAERAAALRLVERLAEANPSAVPPQRLRAELVTSPGQYLRRTGLAVFWSIVGVGGLLALMVVFTDEFREDPVMWGVLGIVVVLALAASLVVGAGGRLMLRDAPRVAALQARWKGQVPRAEEADRRRREFAPRAMLPRWLVVPSARLVARVAAVLTVATLVSLGAFMLSVYMRQQCRTCDPVYWDEPIENGIDVLSLGSGVAIALCAALGIVAWTGGVVLQAAREVALTRWVATGEVRTVDPEFIAPLLSGNRALTRLQLGLSTLGAGGLIFATGAVWAEWTVLDVGPVLGTALVLILVGIVLGLMDSPRARRERQAARDALHPGEAVPRPTQLKTARAAAASGSDD
ncbi:hypothetical protein [Microbacterium hydrocarbonoxydans]|uniref:hypothetical protein n=1 Tax=Microbacterium hydrocarbonoxydans TaxID=273678 RepID=UPI00203D512A|nr:hypothetical protein [Microbacterium hydrocarbonoxydans]MCM3779644.1 hypothetical protein [Microbacterium hydrocarbonoxydans]